MWLLARALGRSASSAFLVVMLVALVGMVLLNTVYVWPKLLGAAYVVCAGVLLLDDARPRPPALIALATTAAALGWLSHGSVSFSLIGLLPVWLCLGCPHWRQLPVAAAVFAATALPWWLYQHFGDPPGNRLLKWHLGGAIPLDERSLLQTLREAYSALSWPEWLAAKRSNFRLLFHASFQSVFDVFTTPAKPRRVDEFFFLWRAIGVLNFAWLVWPVAALVRRRRLSEMRLELLLAGWTVSTVVVWVLLMFIPNSTLLHQGSFAVLLVACSLAVVVLLAAPRWLGWPVLGWHVFYFVMTWLPYFGRQPLDWTLLGLLPISLALLALAARWVRTAAGADGGPGTPNQG